ncbi:MAG: phenylalanine--tRNA ligase subunit beta [Chlamydiales bacterium]|nr:phenylalanine--tRNA ligase subunit beta [Chlamydiia bacterium]MCP5506948.1 phenylalanine--tRNA ligase subunit beta [Chlamydiales bacterium]
MKVPLNWLKEFVDIQIAPIQIGKILTMAGLEVDAIEAIVPDFSNVVVGKVLSVEKHPDADKLCVAQVTDGAEQYQVVCGDPSCRAGMKTAFAKVGATLPEEEEGKHFKIKKTKIRGVESFGMLCTERELQIGDDHSAIMNFDDHIQEGADVAQLYADTVFDISLTPNLSHCANVIGVARELHASTEAPLSIPDIIANETGAPIDGQVKVTIQDGEGCPRYACRLIKDVKVGPSPQWMQSRLLASGVRPINNIVDITNYVLLEMGHPLHAFDYDLIDGHEIIVRQANEGEKFTTLDDLERTLKSGDVMICDKNKLVAIGGVMGGQNSEVSDKTVNILLEAAYFNPKRIRRTSKHLGLMTDASHRFERGADPNMVLCALDRAAMLMHQIAGGAVAQGVVDIKMTEFPEKKIECRVSRVNHVLGTQFSVSEVENIFQRLGFPYDFDGDNLFTVVIPTYRVDISEEIDLVEEVARLYGYDKLTKAVTRFHSSKTEHSPVFIFERNMRRRLLSEGLQEFLTCDLIGPTLLSIVQGSSFQDEEAMVKVVNPTSIEQSFLRTSLLPGLLQVVKYNYDHQNQNIYGFEIGRIHYKNGDRYHEETVAALVLSGKRHPHHWDGRHEEVDFYDLKGIVENMLRELGIDRVSYQNKKIETFHTGRQASVYVDELEIGTIGEVHPSIQRRLDVPQRIYFAEFNLHDLFKSRSNERQMTALAKYPSSSRDWTMTMKDKAPISDVLNIINQIKPPLLESVDLLDIYRSDKIGRDVKNVTFRFVYRDLEKTVAQEVVDREHTQLTDKVRSLMTTTN